jgi:hypothetical protein
VTGTVKYTDGTPVTQGEVRFETDTFTASGKINPDGSYALGSVKATDGVPKGHYAVAVIAAEAGTMSDEGIMPGKVLVAEKYMSARTSGLNCAVTGSTKFDITVEKP